MPHFAKIENGIVTQVMVVDWETLNQEGHPFPSWTKNPDPYLWEPPVPMPTTGMHTWSEETLSWVAVPTV